MAAAHSQPSSQAPVLSLGRFNACAPRKAVAIDARSVTKMVETYAHAVDERRLDEIDAAFETQGETQTASIPHEERT
jgi:hypothetical protein